MTDKVREVDVGAKAELLADVTGEAGAKVSGAGGDDEGIDLLQADPSLICGFASGISGDQRSALGESAMECVWIEGEGFLQIGHREVTKLDAIVTGEHLAEHGLGTAAESREIAGPLKSVPTFPLCVAVLRGRCAHSLNEHG